MREYKEHFVAFMDILGFKELIEKEECDFIYHIFNEIHSNTKKRMNYNGKDILAYEHIKYKILSDSVIVFIDAEIDDSFSALLNICNGLQSSLANRDIPILLRGGIAKGELYYENDIIYGKGLTKAYLLENNLARYPRVVFTGETLEAGKNVAKYMFPDFSMPSNYIKDVDSLYYINYLAYGYLRTEEVKRIFDNLIGLCNRTLDRAMDENVREKYIWLLEYIEKNIKWMSQVERLYVKEREEKMQEEMLEYNARYEIYRDEDRWKSRHYSYTNKYI